MKAADGAELLKAPHWLMENEEYLHDIDIAPFDARAAAEFDKARRIAKLKKIGRADLLIACIALAQKATLVTRNVKHFRLIPGLAVENWADQRREVSGCGQPISGIETPRGGGERGTDAGAGEHG